MSESFRLYVWFYLMLENKGYKSMNEFCKKHSVNKSVVSRYLNEHRAVPVAFAVLLSEAFEVPVQEVIAQMTPQHRNMYHTKRARVAA